MYLKDDNLLGGGYLSLLGTAKTTYFGGIGIVKISKYSPSVYHMNLKNGQVWNMNIRELWKVHTGTH